MTVADSCLALHAWRVVLLLVYFGMMERHLAQMMASLIARWDDCMGGQRVPGVRCGMASIS